MRSRKLKPAPPGLVAAQARARGWEWADASPHTAALSWRGHYTISHRATAHTVSFRPPGQHHHVATCQTAGEAWDAADAHARARDDNAARVEPFCACGRRVSECDRSRRGCAQIGGTP